ncbi:unnamed protein product, partial [Coregonus sp. 'balchen']
GDEKNDNWIFSLAVLLSSTLVYNSLGTIDNNALEKLQYPSAGQQLAINKSEKAKREASERENRAMEEQLEVQERLRADHQRTYEENVNQLMERMKRDSRNAIADYDRVLQARLREQNDLLQQGFDDRAHQMQREIDALKGAKAEEEQKTPSFMNTALDTVGTAATLFLPGIIPKVGGMAVKWLPKWF